METLGRGRCASAALLAALLALVWGAAAYAVTGTSKVLAGPGLDVTSPLSLVVAPPCANALPVGVAGVIAGLAL